ncbi:hypothetical protein B0T24DRAFT_631847 [Lasiosphaeria ovina]|uniref:Uncharacterized protein n=1 Tax=Lasiosphaeria ovina TaxID=92902 RepID=A0AAE0N399_9PEZI|nr:hypothetical protein B0T24DRAFT_631847 [Lasiosphaeria ovina]
MRVGHNPTLSCRRPVNVALTTTSLSSCVPRQAVESATACIGRTALAGISLSLYRSRGVVCFLLLSFVFAAHLDGQTVEKGIKNKPRWRVLPASHLSLSPSFEWTGPGGQQNRLFYVASVNASFRFVHAAFEMKMAFYIDGCFATTTTTTDAGFLFAFWRTRRRFREWWLPASNCKRRRRQQLQGRGSVAARRAMIFSLLEISRSLSPGRYVS